MFCTQERFVLDSPDTQDPELRGTGRSRSPFSVDLHYKHPLPEYVYANYMQYWGSVHLLEKEIPREITRINELKVAQPSAGLAQV